MGAGFGPGQEVDHLLGVVAQDHALQQPGIHQGPLPQEGPAKTVP